MSENGRQRVSIVVPVYNEEERLRSFFDTLRRTTSALSSVYDIEIIVVNDGSTDGTATVLATLCSDPSIRCIEFTRNFGKEIATSAGVRCATGDAVIVMDADLEHPPELIPTLLAKWREGNEVVYTVRTYARETPFIKRLMSRLYYALMRRIASITIEPGASDFRLMSRAVVDEFNRFTEHARFFRGLVDWLGFSRARVEFTAPYDPQRQPTYSLRKLVRLALSGVTSFSLVPLRVAGYLGSAITIGSGLFLCVMLVARWFIDRDIFSPISFVIIFNILLSGIVLMCLGFIAIYIGSIHNEILNRPLYVIKKKMNIE